MPRRVGLVAACLLLSLTGLAACSRGGDDDATAPSPSATTRVPSETPGPTVTPTATGTPDATPTGTPTATPTASTSPTPSLVPTKRPVLPGGGRSIFPEHTVVAYYGSGSGPLLGVLGEGTPTQAAAKLLKAAAPFGPASGRPVLPAFEFIASVAQRSPGDNGVYSLFQPDANVQRYLDAARAAKAIMVLDLQPGRGDFLAQAKHFEKFLKQPDVGLALDPEWQLTPTQRPGRQIGTTTAAKVNEVSAYLQSLVAAGGLPEKLFVVHQFRPSMIANREKVIDRPGLDTVVHIDGFGSQGAKREVYGLLASRMPSLSNGFKLFYDEDIDLMTPKEAMAVRPRPELITYQ